MGKPLFLTQPHMARERGYLGRLPESFRHCHTVTPQTTQRPSKAASYKACYGTTQRGFKTSLVSLGNLCSRYSHQSLGTNPTHFTFDHLATTFGAQIPNQKGSTNRNQAINLFLPATRALPASVAPSPASVFGKVPMEVNQY